MTRRPWYAGGDRTGKRHAPATLRNREAIADILARELPDAGIVLEVASGSGEHAVHFARRFPALVWQPSDPDPAARGSIMAWMAEEGLSNIEPPLDLDAAAGNWQAERADAVFCANMIHISPWKATLGLFAGAARLLGAGAPLILYGPFLEAAVDTAPSNLAFDGQLRAMDPRFGMRAVEELDRLASCHGLVRTARYAMPANNLTLVYRVS